MERAAEPADPGRPAAALGVVVGAGLLGAIQPKINGVLADRLGSALLASAVNFTAAVAGVALLVALRPGTRDLLRHVRTWPVPRWTFAAGLGGVAVVVVGAAAVETIGVAIFSVAFFAGQIAAGLLVDRLGIASGRPRPIVPLRAIAAALALVAVVVAQAGRPVGSFAPALVALVALAGGASALQAACNGRIAGAVGDPFAPTAVNVTLGATTLALLSAVASAAGFVEAVRWPAEPWLYVGGFLGVAIVASLALAAHVVGVLRATLAMLAAQLTAAFVVDWVVADVAPTPGVVVGAALVVVAVVLVGWARQVA